MHRRTFLKTLAGAPVAFHLPAFAQDVSTKPILLEAVDRSIEVNGKAAKVFGLVREGSKPGLELVAGSDFDVTLANKTGEPTLVHWHGLTPPVNLDGVPDSRRPLMLPGETRRYTFPVGTGGTHWMHAHTLQEQNLLAAPLVVRSDADRAADMQEIVVMLHDFSFTPATELLARLTGGKGGGMHGGMSGMMPGGGVLDLNDIAFDAYLANDRTLSDPELVRVEKGGRVRLRVINGATATAFTIDTGALDAELVAVDGQEIQPIRGRSFPIVMGQRLDIRVDIPREGGAFPILALREGAAERTGIVLATAETRVQKIAAASRPSPIVGLDLEASLRPVHPLAARKTDKRLAVTLTGGMGAYTWGMQSSTPLTVRQGERIEIAMRNMSMMTHPMHLHGHRFQVVSIDGRRFEGAVRDTVAVPHMAEVIVAFDADNPGKWAFHCHHLYHMAAGMMDFVTYDGAS
jgi:FtsP/CotA-like multicopper oxidase with cupredoxin domain